MLIKLLQHNNLFYLLYNSMAMYVEPEFISKYKDQFYKQNSSKQQLMNEQKRLYGILNSLYIKIQKCFQSVCSNQQKVHSSRNSIAKDNKYNVAEAQLKNSLTYRQLLQNQKNKLEKRINKTIDLKQKDLNLQIKDEKKKLITLLKVNQKQKVEIKKLGQKLTQDIKSSKQIYDELLYDLKKKKNQINTKQINLIQNQTKIEQLEGKINQIESQMQSKIGKQIQAQWQQDLQTKQLDLQKKLKLLQKNRNKIKQSVESLNIRLSQEYYCKLKQLEAIKVNSQKIDREIQNIRQRLEERIQLLRN